MMMVVPVVVSMTGMIVVAVIVMIVGMRVGQAQGVTPG